MTFLPAEKKVVSQVGEAGYTESRTAPGSFSEPKISFTLSRLGTEVGIPGLQGLNVENADVSASSNVSQPSETAAFTHNLSTAGYLERLEKVASTFPREVHENNEKVNGTDISLLSLKVKEKLDESVIDDLEGQIFTRLEKNNIFLEHPGDSIKIDHLEDDTKKELVKIFDLHSKAFAVDSYDCGSYVGLVVHLDVLENKSAFQRERNMKTSDVQLIKPIMEKIYSCGDF